MTSVCGSDEVRVREHRCDLGGALKRIASDLDIARAKRSLTEEYGDPCVLSRWRDGALLLLVSRHPVCDQRGIVVTSCCRHRSAGDEDANPGPRSQFCQGCDFRQDAFAVFWIPRLERVHREPDAGSRARLVILLLHDRLRLEIQLSGASNLGSELREMNKGKEFCCTISCDAGDFTQFMKSSRGIEHVAAVFRDRGHDAKCRDHESEVATRVRRAHCRFGHAGRLLDLSGVEQPFRANDPELGEHRIM